MRYNLENMFLLKRYHIIVLILLGVIFLVFFYLRFSNLDKRTIFNWDQEQYTNQIYDIIVNHKLTLLGPRVVSDKGFFLAPYFTYILLPFYLITKLHPSALIYFVVSLGVLFFGASFFMIKKMYRLSFAVFFLLLWATNPLLASYDVIPWWPITIPLGVLTVIYLLYRIFHKKNVLDWILLGITLGFFINMHFQFIFMLIFVVLFIFLSRRKLFKPKFVLASVVAFLFMFMPLALFDLRHDYLNLKLFFNFFSQGGVDQTGKDLFVWQDVFTFFIEPLILVRNHILKWVFYFTIFGFMVFLSKTKKGFFRNFYASSLILWLLFPILFMLYGKRPSEYYFVFLYPLIYLVIIDSLLSLRMGILLVIVSIALFVGNIDKFQINLRTNWFGLYYKDKVAQKIASLSKGRKFNVSYDVPFPFGGDTGYRYLLKYYGVEESGDWTDPLIEVKIPPKNSQIVVGKIGIKLPASIAP